MATHTFRVHLDNGTIVWDRRPQDDPTIVAGDVLVFTSLDGPVVLRFNTKSPFASTSAAPFLYGSGSGDLTLTIVGPPGLYEFDCGIRIGDGAVGLDKAGDKIPVGN